MSCEESFTTLNVDIRNHQNLLDSMEQYAKGDLLEGAMPTKCNKKVRTQAPRPLWVPPSTKIDDTHKAPRDRMQHTFSFTKTNEN